MVNRYLYPSDIGRGPTMSKCVAKPVWLWKGFSSGFVCHVIFFCWQGTQVCTYSLVSLVVLCHTKCCLRSFALEHAEGWERPWIISITFCQRTAVMMGHGPIQYTGWYDCRCCKVCRPWRGLWWRFCRLLFLSLLLGWQQGLHDLGLCVYYWCG